MECAASHATRTCRAASEREKDFWNKYSPQARTVLIDLRDKYTDHGVTQIDDLHILEVPPVSDRGTPLEIAHLFGGADELRKAVAELQAKLCT